MKVPEYAPNPPSLKFKYGYKVLWISMDGSTLNVASVGLLF